MNLANETRYSTNVEDYRGIPFASGAVANTQNLAETPLTLADRLRQIPFPLWLGLAWFAWSMIPKRRRR